MALTKKDDTQRSERKDTFMSLVNTNFVALFKNTTAILSNNETCSGIGRRANRALRELRHAMSEDRCCCVSFQVERHLEQAHAAVQLHKG